MLSSRSAYARLDVCGMGVDIDGGPATELDNRIAEQKMLENIVVLDRLIRESTLGIKKDEEAAEPRLIPPLPEGWEKHNDREGDYFWHIKSGTIQRTPPQDEEETRREQVDVVKEVRSSRIFDEEEFDLSEIGPLISASSSFNSADKEKKTPNDEAKPKDPLKMQVRVSSLGWTEFRDEDVCSEGSSRAVNEAISKLASKGSVVDSLEADLALEIDPAALRVLHLDSGVLLRDQPIHLIRVWGVAGEHFAYVAKDKKTRKFHCHAFNCHDAAGAKTAAAFLRDLCKRALIERNLRANNTYSKRINAKRAVNERKEEKIPQSSNGEAGKSVRARLIGSIEVSRPTGIAVLREAVEELKFLNPDESRWKRVTLKISPSVIKIEEEDEERRRQEVRLRYLSFLGIGDDVRDCGFIVAVDKKEFVLHAFRCGDVENAAALCKTIEAACKLRFQKCVDGRNIDNAEELLRQQQQQQQQQQGGKMKVLGDSVRNVFDAWKEKFSSSQPSSPV